MRGLENYTLPRNLRMDRKLRKTKTVRRVLELQAELEKRAALGLTSTTSPNKDECLRLVSEYFSEPSRKFARALGEIDGTFVHLEIMAEAATTES